MSSSTLPESFTTETAEKEKLPAEEADLMSKAREEKEEDPPETWPASAVRWVQQQLGPTCDWAVAALWRAGEASPEAAVPAMMQRTEQLRSRQRQLTQQLEAHRSRMAPLRREADELRHQLAARRKVRQKCRQACQRRLDQVASSLSHIRQEDDFGSQVAAALEQLLFEQEEDMVIMDPSLTITEQVRHRWLREYDECNAECEDLQRNLNECEQQHSDMLPEEKHLEQQIRHAEEVIEQLAQMCRTLRHWDA